MKRLKTIYSIFVVAGVLSLVGYTILNPTSQNQSNIAKGSQNASFYGQTQAQSYYHINLNEALSIQPLPDGRYMALMPVQGGAAWFLIGNPVMAQGEQNSAPVGAFR